MVTPVYGGCMWPLDASCEQAVWDAFDPAVQDRAAALASETLHRLTGGRVGGCPVTVRPCDPKQWHDSVASMYFAGRDFWPVNYNGQWHNICDAGPCGDQGVRLVPPIGRVDEVKVDGVVIDPAEYVVSADRLLSTGNITFPDTQDIALPDTQPGTFSVTYLNAHPVDSLGAATCGRLAIEYAKACTGKKCKLPDGVTTIIRQGISMDIQAGSFPGGMTGIREIDSYLALWNPAHIRRPVVWSPDLDHPRIVRS